MKADHSVCLKLKISWRHNRILQVYYFSSNIASPSQDLPGFFRHDELITFYNLPVTAYASIDKGSEQHHVGPRYLNPSLKFYGLTGSPKEMRTSQGTIYRRNKLERFV